MKCNFIISVVLGAVLSISPVVASELFLVKNGQSNYVIALPEKPSAVEKQSAIELKNFIHELSGCQLPIVPEKQLNKKQKAVYIGDTAFARKLYAPEKFADLPEDTILLRTSGKNLILAGHPQRGTLYAVYQLLEDEFGIRFWSSEDTFIPKKKTLTVKDRNYRYSPPIIVREPFYTDPWRNPVFASRLRYNGHFPEISAAYGGHQKLIGWVHTFDELVPADKYFASHPEYFPLVDGKRIPGGMYTGQICLSNKDVLQIVIKTALEWIKKNPDMKIISISQSDNEIRCQCSDCLAIEKEEGAASGPVIRFVNAVADAIGKQYPDMLVETLAYQYTRHPPKKTIPRDNVLIRLCSIEMNFAQSIANGRDNASFCRDIERWSKIAKQLYIWNYTTNFKDYVAPYPNWANMGDDIRFFVRHKAVGIFEQGDYGSKNGDFVRARTWILSKLLWNPELDQKELEKEFFEKYYGPAGKYLLDYIYYLVKRVEAADGKLYCLRTNHTSYLRTDDIVQAYKLYDKAEAAVKNMPEFAKRVRRERLALDHVFLQFIPQFRREAAIRGEKVKFPKDPLQIAKEFALLIDPEEHWREGAKFGDIPQKMLQKLMIIDPVPVKCAQLPIEAYDVFEEHSFVLYRPGVESQIREDKNSANGKTAWLSGAYRNWSIQVPLEQIYGENQTWQFHFEVRCTGNVANGVALDCGIYDNLNKKSLSSTIVRVENINGSKYKVISSKPVKLPKSNLMIYVQPWGRSAQENFYVDRIYMTRITD